MRTRNTLPALALALMIAVAAATATLAAPGGPKAKPPAGGCTAAASRIAYVVSLSSFSELFAVNPDGSCSVQLTTGSQVQSVLAWTADKHILVKSAANQYRLLAVPNSTSAATVSTVFSWTQANADVGNISQHGDGSGALPVAQQLYVAVENNNVVVYTTDRATRTELTNYVSTYVPGGTGSEFHNSNPQWLRDSADRSRIRLTYSYQRIDYVGGTPQTDEHGLRVVSLGTTGWPAISTSGLTDQWVGGKDNIIGGYPLADYGLIDFSRDGSRAATRGPFGDGIYVLPVLYDDLAGTVTIDTANAVHAATGVAGSIVHGMGFSPDNSKLVYPASTTVGKGGNARTITSLFVIGSASASGAVEVDGRTNEYSCCAVWGPNGG